MEYRFLTEEDSARLDRLVDTIEASIVDEEWWLPIQDLAREHFFDPQWTVFYGAFDDGELVAACALFMTDNEYGESAAAIGLSSPHVAEIGRCMVDPRFRGCNLMLRLNEYLLAYAKSAGVRHVIATAHPSNIASCASLTSLGMEVAGSLVKYGKYHRNIFHMEIKG